MATLVSKSLKVTSDTLLTPPEARQMLGVDYDVLDNIRENWIGLRYFKVERTTRYYKSSIERVKQVRNA